MENKKRLIDANGKGLLERINRTFGGVTRYIIKSILKDAPTVDAVEVVHGRWVFGELDIMGQPVHCSVCGWGSDMVNRAMWLQYDGHKFCGNCGADMRGTADGKE